MGYPRCVITVPLRSIAQLGRSCHQRNLASHCCHKCKQAIPFLRCCHQLVELVEAHRWDVGQTMAAHSEEWLENLERSYTITIPDVRQSGATYLAEKRWLIERITDVDHFNEDLRDLVLNKRY